LREPSIFPCELKVTEALAPPMRFFKTRKKGGVWNSLAEKTVIFDGHGHFNSRKKHKRQKY